MRGWWQDLTDLVLPAECAGCGRPRTVLCPRCRAAVAGGVPRRVRPVPEPPGLPAVYAAAGYADEVRAAVLAHKERGLMSLAAPLGAALAGAVRAGLRGTAAGPSGPAGAPDGHGGRPAAMRGRAPVLLVPVPSARRAVRARGHDPTRRIALAAAAGLRRGGVAAQVLAVLRQRRGVSDQSRLGSRQRRENLTGALTTAAGGAGLLLAGPVVLVDDLMTTGASLAEAARAVTSAVYSARVREEMEAYRTGRSRKEGNPVYRASELWRAYGAGHVICAAVVAASPDSVVEKQELTKNVHRCR
ncbi:ComF family protein [Streptomyces thermodiastaticus]|uniref:ComF family protein n=1 Tax=Streptomyces thermodiastaticus TaxID=44061 RepID=UPI001F34E944|nr:ComF family protein [Streptomyces thermodiastaticus]MCE7552233.1 ComF family protein [Streptomyces thermodiastaticus]